MAAHELHPRVRAIWDNLRFPESQDTRATLVLASEVARLNDLLDSCTSMEAPLFLSMSGENPPEPPRYVRFGRSYP